MQQCKWVIFDPQVQVLLILVWTKGSTPRALVLHAQIQPCLYEKHLNVVWVVNSTRSLFRESHFTCKTVATPEISTGLQLNSFQNEVILSFQRHDNWQQLLPKIKTQVMIKFQVSTRIRILENSTHHLEPDSSPCLKTMLMKLGVIFSMWPNEVSQHLEDCKTVS